MKWRSSWMKLSYTRPGNAQFIAKIFVFNTEQRKLQREKCTRRDIYISNMCFLYLIAWRELIAESKEQFVCEKCQTWFNTSFFFFYLFSLVIATNKYDNFIIQNGYKNYLQTVQIILYSKQQNDIKITVNFGHYVTN